MTDACIQIGLRRTLKFIGKVPALGNETMYKFVWNNTTTSCTIPIDIFIDRFNRVTEIVREVYSVVFSCTYNDQISNNTFKCTLNEYIDKSITGEPNNLNQVASILIANTICKKALLWIDSGSLDTKQLQKVVMD